MAFPVNNYGSLIRGMTAIGQRAASVSSPIVSIPRPKYAYLTLFEFEPTADMSQFDEAYRTGRVLAATQSISHPQVSFTTETLRSYNAVRNVPVKIEYQPATITFYDDTTGVVANFLKLYRKFYHHSGDATGEFDFGDGIGKQGRAQSSLSSIGMKTRTSGRHLIRKITVFDLGTAPTGVNLYHFINPFVESINHDELSYYDASGFVNVTLNMQYEGYYEELNQNAADYQYIFEQFQDSGRTFGALVPNPSDSPDFFGGASGRRSGAIIGQTDDTVVPGLGDDLSTQFSTTGRAELNSISSGGSYAEANTSPISRLRELAETVEIGLENVTSGTGKSFTLSDKSITTNGVEPYINHTATATRSRRAVAAEEGEGTDRATDIMNAIKNGVWNVTNGGFGV